MGIAISKLPDKIFEYEENYQGKKEKTKYKIEQIPTRESLKLLYDICEFFGLDKVSPIPKTVTPALVQEFIRSDKAVELITRILSKVSYEITGDKGKAWIVIDETQLDLHFTGRYKALLDLITEVIDYNGFFELTDSLMSFLPQNMLMGDNPLIDFLMMSGKNG